MRKITQEKELNRQIESILGKKTILELTPIIIKKADLSDKICFFFDTDDNASPFDINMAYDAGFDIVVPISKMTADQVPKLVQDAIFSRKPKAPTTFFIGGSNVKEAEKIAKEVIKSLIPPFECPVIIDPRGSHTTASAIVALTLQVARIHGFLDLSGKKIICLGGTGPVGQIAALIASKINAKVIITSRREQFVKELAEKLTIKAGKGATKIIGEVADTDEQYLKIVKDADIIWSVGKAGVQILSNKIMNQLPPNKIIVDINLVPPYGIEGIKPKHDNNEIYPGIFGIGALALGRLKANVEGQILKEAAATKGLKIYDYNYAFNVAKTLLARE
ncbi:MAG: hypothetical protein KGD73_03090 [Candidatus Lokiarchaeota archaeon]|nr:hypothetical protein [Candidatus Lokiarchaeota archaeon]